MFSFNYVVASLTSVVVFLAEQKIKKIEAGPVFEISAKNSSGPGRADSGRKFSKAGPIPQKQVWRKMTPQ